MSDLIATNAEIIEREQGLCLVCGRVGHDVHEIRHRSDYPKDKQAEAGIFAKENRCLLCREHHQDLGSGVIAKIILRYLLHVKYGYPRPDLK